jgi:hypothetical protein
MPSIYFYKLTFDIPCLVRTGSLNVLDAGLSLG